MGYLVSVLGALVLLVGFYVLTLYEAKNQRRLFADYRERLDRSVEHIELIIEHVDFGAFIREEIRHAMNHAGHAIAHLSLQAVREVEHLLTRLVRHLRMRKEDTAAPRESAREFVKTLSDFKGTLKMTHPDVSDIKDTK